MASPRALSAYDILEKLRRTGIKSPPTVYRALEKLTAQGLIHRLESLNAYIACCQHDAKSCHHEDGHDHAHDHVSQFAICTSCGIVKEIENKALAKAMKQVGENFLATIDKKVFEVAGTCRDCAAQD